MISIKLPKEQSSYWLATAPISHFASLRGEVSCDVVIVGGGIAGLTAAYKLKQAGLSVAVVEKNSIVSGYNRRYDWQSDRAAWIDLCGAFKTVRYDENSLPMESHGLLGL